MNQTRKGSLIESLVNVIVGFGIAYISQWTFFWMIEEPLHSHTLFWLTVFMTFVSIARSYTIRRVFNSQAWLHWKRA